jgi:hypothetical protein
MCEGCTERAAFEWQCFFIKSFECSGFAIIHITHQLLVFNILTYLSIYE